MFVVDVVGGVFNLFVSLIVFAWETRFLLKIKRFYVITKYTDSCEFRCYC